MSSPSVHQMVESIIGCKWSLTVLSLVRKGVRRPGEMEHAIDGLSGKVLNERLAKLVRFGILDKTSFPEVPPAWQKLCGVDECGTAEPVLPGASQLMGAG